MQGSSYSFFSWCYDNKTHANDGSVYAPLAQNVLRGDHPLCGELIVKDKTTRYMYSWSSFALQYCTVLSPSES